MYGYKYYTTMNYDTFMIVGNNKETLSKANELFLNMVSDNSAENVEKFEKFIAENEIQEFDDVSENIEFPECELLGSFVSRF